MPATQADAWKLESFLDSLIVELDRAQDTLSIKGVTRRLTYAVRDVAVDLFVFPRYEEGRLRFSVARPGENGASRISFQLGSITDRQIQESTNDPVTQDDVAIEDIDDLDGELRRSLQSVGVRSVGDVERLAQRRVDLGTVIADKGDGKAAVNYDDLAAIINKARRRKVAPSVHGLSLTPGADFDTLTITGNNLAVDGHSDGFPMALVNDRAAEVVTAEPGRLELTIGRDQLQTGANALKLALDPYAVVDLELGIPKDEEK
jgi:hypothetical protein